MNRFKEAAKTSADRIEDAKDDIAKTIVAKFRNPAEVVAIERMGPENLTHQMMASYYHNPSKIEGARLTVGFIGGRIIIEKWFNEQDNEILTRWLN